MKLLWGAFLPAGLGQAPARQASLGAGLPLSAGVTTINKVCGSGLKAVMLAHDLIKAGSAEVVVAGGFESMSNAPYMLPKARTGYRMGHGQVLDHMMLDGLENAYDGKRWDVLRKIQRMLKTLRELKWMNSRLVRFQKPMKRLTVVVLKMKS